MMDNDFKRQTERVDQFVRAVRQRVRYTLGKKWNRLNGGDLFHAVALVVRDTLIDRMFETEERYRAQNAKRLYYLSMEFLMGRSLGNNLYNLGIQDLCESALHELGVELEDVREGECDAALGNGGLGRLAACFLDSLATLDYPGFGYGINYEYGLFKQLIQDGYQKEKPDHWLAEGSPWQIERRDQTCIIPVFGRVEENGDESPRNSRWLDWNVLIGCPSDMPVVGYGGKTVNYLRLYRSEASEEFDIEIFNSGDYLKAVEQKVTSERISKVLYPSDAIEEGRELRLLQEYFFVACAIQDIFRRFFENHSNLNDFPSFVAIQLNDTHPALAVPEMMRMLVDEHGVNWDRAWQITVRTLAFTNHTLLPEALEKWPTSLLERILPRHLQIIYDINDRFLEEVRGRWPDDNDRINRVSLVENGGDPQIRMANLAIVGTHSINGVAELHSKLIQTVLVPDFYEMWPERFCNKTNGITQRRWLIKSNPDLARLITRAIGDKWITDLDRLRGLEDHLEDPGFLEDFRNIKRANKDKLGKLIEETTMAVVDPDSIFDVQAKRFHEYKRQLLNILHVVHLYLRIVEDGYTPPAPRTFIQAGKAAPGYWEAKQIIKLVNSVAAVVNQDPKAQEWLRVVFIPDYRVSLAERIIPAADISEQISTAGMEASGTGNMKFALNGALTIGTFDGANIEIQEEVGEENIFIFGLRTDEIASLRSDGTYDPEALCKSHPSLARVMEAIRSDRFCANEPGLFQWIYDKLMSPDDRYLHLADFPSYIEIHERAVAEYTDSTLWTKKAILNTARVGKFSSDRTIQQYAREIWKLRQIKPL